MFVSDAVPGNFLQEILAKLFLNFAFFKEI